MTRTIEGVANSLNPKQEEQRGHSRLVYPYIGRIILIGLAGTFTSVCLHDSNSGMGRVDSDTKPQDGEADKPGVVQI